MPVAKKGSTPHSTPLSLKEVCPEHFRPFVMLCSPLTFPESNHITPHLCLLVSYILTSYSTISHYRLMGGGDSRHSQQNIEDANVGPTWAAHMGCPYGLPI